MSIKLLLKGKEVVIQFKSLQRYPESFQVFVEQLPNWLATHRLSNNGSFDGSFGFQLPNGKWIDFWLTGVPYGSTVEIRAFSWKIRP